jgi:hypothetical protein
MVSYSSMLRRLRIYRVIGSWRIAGVARKLFVKV